MTSPDLNEPVDDAGRQEPESGMLLRVFERFSIPKGIARVSTDTVFYGIGKAGEGLAALILIPVLTRAFTPAEFGLWDVTMTFFMLVTVAASLALEVSLSVFYFETRDAAEREAVASTSVYFRLFSSTLLAFIILIFSPQISEIVFDTPRHAVYFRIVAAAIPFFLAMNIFKQLLRLSFSPGKFNVVAIGYAVLYAALGVFLTLNMKMGVSGILLAVLGAAFCFSIVGGLLARGLLSVKFSWSLLKKMLAFGLPVLPTLFACWIIDFSDRYFLARLSTLEQVGVYSVGARTSSMIVLFVTSFQMAWAPFALSIQRQEDAEEEYSRGLFLFLVTALSAGTAIVVFAKPLLIVLTQPQYYGAERVIPLLVLATIAYGAFLIISVGLMIAKKASLASVSIAVGAVLNLILNFLLIPRFEMMGAAAATLIAYTVALALVYQFAKTYYPVPYDIPRIIKLALLSLSAMAISWMLGFQESGALDILLRSLLIIIFLVLVARFFLLKPGRQ